MHRGSLNTDPAHTKLSRVEQPAKPHARRAEHAQCLLDGVGSGIPEVEQAAREGLVLLGADALESMLVERWFGRRGHREAVLSIVRELRTDFEWLGTVLQAYLKRTHADCVEFAGSAPGVEDDVRWLADACTVRELATDAVDALATLQQRGETAVRARLALLPSNCRPAVGKLREAGAGAGLRGIHARVELRRGVGRRAVKESGDHPARGDAQRHRKVGAEAEGDG